MEATIGKVLTTEYTEGERGGFNHEIPELHETGMINRRVVGRGGRPPGPPVRAAPANGRGRFTFAVQPQLASPKNQALP